MPLRTRALTAASLALILAAPCGAQRVVGPNEDAWTLPAGVTRFSLSTRFLGARDAFGESGRERLGANMAGLLDGARFPAVHDAEGAIGALTGNNSFRLSVGTARANVRIARAVIPLDVAAGITSRITLRASVPFFTGEQDVQWLLDSTGANVGVNPASVAAGPLSMNSALIAGLDTAAATLERVADGCVANAVSDPRCTQILAELTQVRELIQRTRIATNALATTYGGRTGVSAAPFVPRDGSAVHTAVTQQVEALRTGFGAYGTTSIPAGTGPAGAFAPVTITQLRALLADSAYGYALAPVSRRYAQGMGDIDVGVTLRVFDGIGAHNPWARDSTFRGGVRQSVGLTYRIGTGTGPDPDDPFKLPTGDGQNDIEVASFTDFIFRRSLWASLIVRWTKQQAYDGVARIPDASGSPFIPLWRRRDARTALGDRIEIEAGPRWIVSDYLAFGARWRWTQQGATRIDELAPFTDAIKLSYEGQSSSVQEVGLGFSWSTVAAWRAGRSKWPMEIQWDRRVAVSGSGGVPAFSADRISLRAYAKLWGK